MNEAIKYIQYQESYRQSLLELLGQIWSQFDHQDVVRRFSWRYENNYCLHEYAMYVAIVGQRVVGFRGYTAQRYCFNEKSLIVLTPSDAIVHPDFRRKGVFDHLMKLSMQSLADHRDRLSLSVFLNTSSNEKSTPSYIKLGWLEFTAKDSFSRISITSLARSIIHKCNPPRCSQKFGSSNISVGGDVDASQIREIKHFIKYPIEHDKSDDYYNWRYNDSGEKYNFIVFSVCGSPRAFLIVKEYSKHFGLVMDYAAESQKDFKKIIEMSSQALGYSVMRIRIAGGAHEERKSLLKCGFFPDSKLVSIAKRKRKPPVLLKCVDPDNNGYSVNGVDIMNPKNWRLLAGESH